MRGCRYLTLGETYLLINLVFCIPIQSFSAECPEVGKLVSADGLVEKKSHGREQWRTALLDDMVCQGDALRTFQKSRAAVRLTDDTLVRLDGDSSLVFTRVEEKKSTLLDLVQGAVHFISRTPRNLIIRTPYVNAMIEGTEFVVRIKDNATDVTVFEGTVVASNKAGSIQLAANQAAHAVGDQAPTRLVQVRPQDAVAWALYYPPLPETPSVADKLARESVIAIVQNRLADAAELARRSLAADSGSAAAYMAKSYVDQASFDIPAALEDIQRAAELAPQSALVQARLAEVWMMSGDSQAARRSAGRAVSLDPRLSLAHTVLGFASLREIDLDAAKGSFRKAISLDSANPLPRLGLGLAKIRQGQLASGREEIETAVLLDPNKALLRSYLGKAYYEEKRDSLASGQLLMAKGFDPNDPTAWYYDSILLQSLNRPIEALQAQQKAIALNDNRGVYRSRQLLDRDEAARSVSLSRIYSDLNFEQQARSQVVNALMLDPANHSAHRFLADSYAGIANLDAARRSELLQSKLTQPLNLDPLQPQLSHTNLGLLDGNGPGDLSYNEYNPLFTRNGMALQMDASVAEKSTWGDDVIVAGLFDNLMFSIGQYHKESDLVAAENGYQQDITNGFVQYQLNEKSSIQLEVSSNEEEKGDVTQRLLPEFLHKDDLQIESEISSVRLGFNRSLTSDATFLLSLIRTDFDFTNFDKSSPFTHTINTQDREFGLYEAQVVGKLDAHSWLVGLGRQTRLSDDSLDVIYLPPYTCPTSSCLYPSHADIVQTRLYSYLNYQAGSKLSLSGGLTLLSEKNRSRDDIELRKGYPKLGLRYVPATGHEILLAAFRSRVGIIPASLYKTLEPTHIAGFNQLYDDISKTDSRNYSVAYNSRFSNNLHAGTSLVFRKLETEIGVIDTSAFPPSQSIQGLDYSDRYASLWLNWTASRQWVLGVDYIYNNYDMDKGVPSASSTILAPDGIINLTTHELATSLKHFFAKGFVGELTATYYDQTGEFVDESGTMKERGKDSGTITDLSLSYRLPKRKGSVSIGVKNIFDNDLNYEDRSSYDTDAPLTASPSSFVGERVLYGTVSVGFR